jgi:hypothetical protein
MKFKLLGLLLIALPITLVTLLGTSDMEYAWYYSEHYKLYDLIKSTVLLLTMMVGSALAFRDGALYFNFAIGFAFVLFQTLAWSFDSPRYLSKVHQDDLDVILSLVSHDAGAFSSTSFTNLDVAHKKYVLFFKLKSLESFDNVKFGTLSFNKDQSELDIELELYSGEKKSIRYDVSDLEF